MSITSLIIKSTFAFLAIGSVTGAALLAFRKAFTRDVVIALGSTLCVAAIAAYSYFIEPNWIEVHNVRIHDQKLAEVLEGTKIVQITDLHLRNGVTFREKQMIEKVNALNPDLIFVTGDIIDDLTQAEPANQIFKSLKAKIGIYGVPGNTDHIVMDSESLARALSESGMDMMRNEKRVISLPNGKLLYLIGVDDPVYGYARLDQAMFGVPEGIPTILLAHGPNILDRAIQQKINLVLVGHTHGGQVGIPFLVRLSRYANRTIYMKGLFEKDGTQMYVNRGIGTKTLPIRFFCRPEIAVIEVEK